MMSMKTLVAFALLASVAAITPQAKGSTMLRFQGTRAPDEKESSALLTPGSPKPLSMAMKCVLSLVCLNFIVLFILKLIMFVGLMKDLYKDMQEDIARTGMKVPDIPDSAPPMTAGAGDKAAELAGKVPGGAAAAAAAARAKEEMMKMFGAEKLAEVNAAMTAVPMFCILMVFSRLRAKVDLETEPQKHAKQWMMIGTIGLFVEIMFTMLPSAKGFGNGVGTRVYAYLLQLVKLFGMVATYAGIVILIVAIFNLKYKEDQMTPAASPTAAAADAAATATASADVSGAGSAATF